MFNSYIEVSKKALIHNAIFLKKRAGKSKICFNLKSNAYGHDALLIAKILKKLNPEYLSVHSIEEAIKLRNSGVRSKIYVLGYIDPKDSDLVATNNLEVVIYSKQLLLSLTKSGKKYKKRIGVHLKIETGLNRQGIKESEIESIKKELDSPFIDFKYITTHFIDNQDNTDLCSADNQLEILDNVFKNLKQNFPNLKKHIGNSASLINQEKYHLDLSRPGISLYGYWSSQKTRQTYLENHEQDTLKPISTWKTKIAQIKEVDAGQKIGYSGTYTTKTKELIAVLPVGYYEGISRNYTLGKSGVEIKNKFCPFVGRICMNNSMVVLPKELYDNLNDLKIATIISNNYNSIVSAENVALNSSRINYQIFTDINETAVKRILI